MNQSRMLSFFLVLGLKFFLLSTSSLFAARGNNHLEIMSYNVENLFDTVHDEGHNDWTFTPKDHREKILGCRSSSTTYYYRKECLETDWHEEKLELKLNQIRDMVFKERKGAPDILALIEVENKHVLGKLAQKLGYKKFVISNGTDPRGIDVALLYQTQDQPQAALKFVETKEYNLKKLGVLEFETRNILEVIFQVNNEYYLSVFVNHWPSQGKPSDERFRIAQFFEKIIEERLMNPRHKVIAVGDFNSIPQDFPHPFDDVLVRGGKGILKDVYQELNSLQKSKMPLGSYYYTRTNSWNHLDRILVSHNLLPGNKKEEGLEVVHDSFEIYAPSFATQSHYRRMKNGEKSNQTEAIQIPKRYNFSASQSGNAGYSDHFPLVIKIKY